MPTASSCGGRPRKVPGWGPVVLAAVVGLGVGDSIKPAREQFGARLAVGLIDTYRATLSLAFERTGLIRCRFIRPARPTAVKRSCVTACLRAGRSQPLGSCAAILSRREERTRSPSRRSAFARDLRPTGAPSSGSAGCGLDRSTDPEQTLRSRGARLLPPGRLLAPRSPEASWWFSGCVSADGSG